MGPARPTVLAVDDEPQNLKLFERALRNDYTVLMASSAHEGLALLAEHPEIAVIVTDQRMPHMSGIEMLKVSRERNPDKVRIILTGYTEPSDLIEAINDSKVFCYMVKPWKIGEMRRILRRAVNLNRSGGAGTIDEVTGLPNHQAVGRIVHREIARVEEMETALSLVCFRFSGIDGITDVGKDEEVRFRLAEAVRAAFESLAQTAINPLCVYKPNVFIGLLLTPRAKRMPETELVARARHELGDSTLYAGVRSLVPDIAFEVAALTYESGNHAGATDLIARVVKE